MELVASVFPLCQPQWPPWEAPGLWSRSTESLFHQSTYSISEIKIVRSLYSSIRTRSFYMLKSVHASKANNGMPGGFQ